MSRRRTYDSLVELQPGRVLLRFSDRDRLLIAGRAAVPASAKMGTCAALSASAPT